MLNICLFFVLCTPFCVYGQDAKVLGDEMELIFKMLRPNERKALVEDYVSVMTSSFLDIEEKQIVDSVFRDLQKLRVTVSWYYFEFSDKNMYTLSSNDEYNKIIKNKKADDKVMKDEEKKTLYTITLCPESKIERFLKRVEN